MTGMVPTSPPGAYGRVPPAPGVTTSTMPLPADAPRAMAAHAHPLDTCAGRADAGKPATRSAERRGRGPVPLRGLPEEPLPERLHLGPAPGGAGGDEAAARGHPGLAVE